MIRLTKILSQDSLSVGRKPVVVWNITKRCNLNCIHCYINASHQETGPELSTEEAKATICEFADVGVPMIIFSGGEPLLRKDIFKLGGYAKKKGINVVLSSNGTLINKDMASKIQDAGFSYVGISLDGTKYTNDKFRGAEGAFEKSIEGLRRLREVGVKSGMRFTITKYNYEELGELIALAQKEKVMRFCIYNLVYTGRGRNIAENDITNKDRLENINYLLKEAEKLGDKLEILTVCCPQDGIMALRYKGDSKRVREYLKVYGGCSAGDGLVCIGPLGDIYPCQFWRKSLGNIKEQRFGHIWNNSELLLSLRNKEAYLTGKCGRCEYKDICGGCRVRAEAVSQDIWAEDPTCYL
ncbi:radical SAM protein [bacterium]|nr:radical SAM protein [bacterium]